MEQPHFVLAVLLVNDRYVMQLRDDKPGIAAPGMWALFGGRVETGEEVRVAVMREIEEELSIQLSACSFLWSVEDSDPLTATTAQYSFFEADITDVWNQHCVMEGQAAAHFTVEQLDNLTMPTLIRDMLKRHHSERANAPTLSNRFKT